MTEDFDDPIEDFQEYNKQIEALLSGQFCTDEPV